MPRSDPRAPAIPAWPGGVPHDRSDSRAGGQRIAACNQALALNLKYYIPGHGPSGGTGVIEPYCDYLKTLYGTVSGLYAEGLSDFEMKDEVIEDLAAFKDWDNFDDIGRAISHAYLRVEQDLF